MLKKTKLIHLVLTFFLPTASVVASDLESQVFLAKPSEFPQLESNLIQDLAKEPNSAFCHSMLSRLYLRMYAQDKTRFSLLSSAFTLADQAMDLDPHSVFSYQAKIYTEMLLDEKDAAMGLLALAYKEKFKDDWRIRMLALQLNPLAKEQQFNEFLNLALQADHKREIVLPEILSFLTATEPQILDKLQIMDKKFSSALIKKALAREYFARGLFKDAEIIYKEILDKFLDSETLLELAYLEYAFLQNNDKGRMLLERANKLASKEQKVIVDLHLVLLSIYRGDLVNSNKQAFDFLKNKNNMNAENLEKIISAYKEKKYFAQLLDLIHDINRKIHGMSELYALEAQLQMSYFNSSEKAIEALEKAIILEDFNPDFYNSLGLIYQDLKNYEKALGLFVRAIDLDPFNYIALYNKACALSRLNLENEALEALKQALQLEPNLAVAAKKDPDFLSIKNSPAFLQLTNLASGVEQNI